MEPKYLIDTNVIIDFSANLYNGIAYKFVAQIIDDNPVISVINKIELLGFSQVSNEIIEFVESSTIINLTAGVINRTITIRKKFKIKLPDAIIAATAIENNCILVTRN